MTRIDPPSFPAPLPPGDDAPPADEQAPVPPPSYARPAGPTRNEALAKASAAWSAAHPDPACLDAAARTPGAIHTVEVARTPKEELEALVRGTLDAIPELAGVDPLIKEMILPADDMAARMQFFSGEGRIKEWFGESVLNLLHLPTDGRSWPVVFRSDAYDETAADGESVDFVHQQTINVVDGRALREETIHLYSIMRDEDGSPRLPSHRGGRTFASPRSGPTRSGTATLCGPR